MFENKTDDPAKDRFVFFGSLGAGIALALISYFYILTHYISYLPPYTHFIISALAGIVTYLLAGVGFTIYLISRRSLSKDNGHKFKPNNVDDRWDNLEVTDK